MPPVQVQTGPVQAVKKTGEEVNLSGLPFLTHTEMDEGASLLMGAAIARSPGSGAITVSLPQVQLLEGDVLAVFAEEDSPLARCIAAAREEDQSLDFALVIGMHPKHHPLSARQPIHLRRIQNPLLQPGGQFFRRLDGGGDFRVGLFAGGDGACI